MRDQFDVAVVGAGPAGSAAAYHLASAGVSVLVVERKHFPRDKVCGDVLTPRGLRALARLGLSRLPRDHFRVNGVRFLNGSRRRIWSFADDAKPFNYGSVIPRTVLDDHLRQAAEGAGALLWQGASASELLTNRSGRVVGLAVDRADGRREIEARLTILCDGTTGLLSRRLGEASSGRGDQPGFALRQYVDRLCGLDPFVEFHLPLTWRGRRLSGYGWMCPISETTANVGAGFLHEEVTDATSLVAVFEGYLRELCVRNPRFANARLLGSPEGGIIRPSMGDPFAMPLGVLAAGDAAGLANPYIGEGIVYALESGELASRSAFAMLRPGPSRRVYAKALVKAFPQQWALRGIARHHRWVGSGDIIYERGQSSHGIIAALSSFILDRPLDPDPSLEALTRNTAGRRIAHLLKDTHQTLVEQVRLIDPVAAEVVARLPCSRSRAFLPILVAGCFASAQRLRDPLSRGMILAMAAFALAEVVHDDVQEGPMDRTHAANSLAIVIGDCLLGEASHVLARLPRPTYARMATALREAAEARTTALAGSTVRLSVGCRYQLLGAPATALASVLMQGHPPGASTDAFAQWLITTFLATLDLEQRFNSETADYLKERLGKIVECGHQSRLRSASVSDWLVTRARAALAPVETPPLSERYARW